MTAPDHRRNRSKISCIDGAIHTCERFWTLPCISLYALFDISSRKNLAYVQNETGDGFAWPAKKTKGACRSGDLIEQDEGPGRQKPDAASAPRCVTCLDRIVEMGCARRPGGSRMVLQRFMIQNEYCLRLWRDQKGCGGHLIDYLKHTSELLV